MITVSIAVQFHSASICILNKSDVVFFLQEERVSRVKYDSSLPLKCVEYIKKYTKNIDNLCLINVTEDQKNNIINDINTKNINFNNLIVTDINHHLYHAASSFYMSGFDEAACIVIDGAGSSFELLENQLIAVETTSIYHAKYPSEFNTIFKNLFYGCNLVDEFEEEEVEKLFDYDTCLSSHLDVGMMYGTVSNHLGFSFKGQGKTMGLYSYGKQNPNMPEMLCKDTLISNSNLFKNNRQLNTKIYPQLKIKNDFQFNADLCFELQKSLEKIFLDRVSYAVKKTKCKNLVFSGGCALNIVGNSLIKEKFPEVNFFVDPIAEDASQSFGAAKFHYHQISGDTKKNKLNTLYLGHDYKINKEKIISEIKKYSDTAVSENIYSYF